MRNCLMSPEHFPPVMLVMLEDEVAVVLATALDMEGLESFKENVALSPLIRPLRALYGPLGSFLARGPLGMVLQKRKTKNKNKSLVFQGSWG